MYPPVEGNLERVVQTMTVASEEWALVETELQDQSKD